MKPALITHYMHTRGGVILLWVIAMSCSYMAMTRGAVAPFTGQGGLALPSANNWLPGGGWASWGVSMGVNALSAVMAIVINRAFNVLRSMTMLFAGLYAIMMIGTPSLFGQLYGGTLLILAVLMSQMILYACYASPGDTRRIFLMFFIMSLTALVCRAALFYLPVLLLGCVQMRVLNWRSFLASLIGVITPAWILLGFGIISIDHFTWPNLENVFPLLDSGDMLPYIVTVGFTMLIGLLATLVNLVKMIGYNTQTRAFNGFITVVLIATAALTIFDMEDALIFVPVLNMFSAIQLAGFFSRHDNSRHGFLPIWGLVVIYILLSQWSLWA